MCGRFSFYYDWNETLKYFGIRDSIPAPPPRYNIAPGQGIHAIIQNGSVRKIGELRWGLVPDWAKDESIGYKMINARAGTLNEKPAFKRLIARRRCIIPADGFYEWRKDEGRKQPMRITLVSRPLFGFAGLWDTWTRPDGSKLSTCTIITCTSNELMDQIHDRMPVILSREDESTWLDRDASDAEHAMNVLRPYPAEDMQAFLVSNAVGNWRNDTPDLVRPI